MRVTPPNLTMPATPTRVSSYSVAEQPQSSEAPQHRRADERIHAQALISSAAMSFAVHPRGNSITVTVADRSSGEVLRQLVYKFGRLPQPTSERSGTVIDITA